MHSAAQGRKFYSSGSEIQQQLAVRFRLALGTLNVFPGQTL